jgi:hypothetical protein
MVAVLAITAILQVMVDLAVDIGRGHTSYEPVFEWRWLPAVLIPEIILVLGFLGCWVGSRARKVQFSKGVVVVLVASCMSVFIFPLLARATDYQVLHGLPGQHTSDR